MGRMDSTIVGAHRNHENDLPLTGWRRVTIDGTVKIISRHAESERRDSDRYGEKNRKTEEQGNGP